MKIYIATPVNARSEATLEEKRQAAWERMCEVRKQLYRRFPDYEFHSSFDEHITPINKEVCKSESMIMGECISEVMCCDMIFLDWGWEKSQGCQLEHYAAYLYGKCVRYACNYSIEPEKEWKPMTFEQAVETVKANPITEDMSYEERLAAQKRRYGL